MINLRAKLGFVMTACRRTPCWLAAFLVFDVDEALEESAPAALRVSNGWLPELTLGEVSDVRCTKALAREDAKLFSAIHKNLSRCLDAAQSAVLLDRSAASALDRCHPDPGVSRSLAERNLKARDKALSRIASRCGELTDVSEPFTASAVEAHLDLVWCRAEEVAGASYSNARDLIATAIEKVAGPSFCLSELCLGGIAAGQACTGNSDCATKSLVGEATACLHETATPP